MSDVATLPGWRRLAALFIKVASAQSLVQLFNILTGVWIIRRAPQSQYAYYTIGNTLLYTIVMLADSGITASLSAIGGKVWQDRQRMGSLLSSGLRLRVRLMMVVTAFLLPAMVILLIHNGAPLLHALAVAAIVGATVIGELTVHTYLVVFRLRQQFNFTQRVALYGAASRTLWLGLWIAGTLNAEAALVASSVNTAVQWLWLRSRVHGHADLSFERDPAIEKEMKTVMLRQLPLTIYFCLQGQIAIWLASTFGNAASVSGLGALARLGAVFTVSQAVMQEIVYPGFARVQSMRLVSERYLQIAVGYGGFLAVTVCGIVIMRKLAMAVLGPQYASLSPQLPLAMFYCALNAFSQVLWGLNYCRAWILAPFPYIAVMTSVQLGLFAIFGAYTLDRILWLTILSLIPALVFAVHLSLTKIHAVADEIPVRGATLTEVC